MSRQDPPDQGARDPGSAEPTRLATILARTARSVAAAENVDDALARVVSTIRTVLGASGAALLRADKGYLVPVASDGLIAAERIMDETALTPQDGGGYPLILAGRVEGVLLLAQVSQARLAAEESALAALLDLAAVTLRNARLTEEQRLREISSFERLSTPPNTSITARALGSAPLRVAQPELFQELSQRYADLLDQALEERVYQVQHQVSESLRAIAEQLGFLKAGPRDVIELHTAALKSKTDQVTASKAQAYLEEARVLVLELMGHLTSYYRTNTMGAGG